MPNERLESIKAIADLVIIHNLTELYAPGQQVMTKKKRKKNKKPRTSGKGRRSMKRGSDVARGKMSEIIAHIVSPWIECLGQDPPLPAVEFAYQTCRLVWNVSRLPNEEDREGEFKMVAQKVVDLAPRGKETEMQQLVEMLYRRALKLYPEDPRIIVNMKIEDLGDGDFHVLVASSRKS